MKGTAKALAHAQESASALALDEQEYIEPVIVVPEGNVLTRVAHADALDVSSARELFLVDKQTFTSSQPSNKGFFSRLRNVFGRLNRSIHRDRTKSKEQRWILTFVFSALPIPLANIPALFGADIALSLALVSIPGLCFLYPALIATFGDKSFTKASKETGEKLNSLGFERFSTSIWKKFDGSRFSIGRPSLASLTQAINEIEKLNETHLTKLREFARNAQLSSEYPADSKLYENMVSERPLFESLLSEYDQRVLEIQEILSREEV